MDQSQRRRSAHACAALLLHGGGRCCSHEDEKTRWLAGVDLGATRSVSRVVLRLPAGWGARTQTLSLQAGADGSTFTTVKAAAAYDFDPGGGQHRHPHLARHRPALVPADGHGQQRPAGQLSEFEVRSS
ncbi:discoidin domain-containing protein [Streptomyces fagopyri]|uniref:discoidin domain-containing protein n=1 Tax=Streptomyces fagopyri TaxID=2662397 RepID=UPI0033EDD2C7